MSDTTTEAAGTDDTGPPPPPVTSTDGTTELGEVSELDAAVVPGVAVMADVAEPDAEPLDDESLDDEVSLEPAGRRRKQHRVRTSPLRTVVMAAVAVVVAIALPVLGVVAARTIANSREGKAVESDEPPVRRLPSTPASLLVGLDADGKPAMLTVLSVAGDGQGGTVLVLPLTTAVYLDGLAKPVRLEEAWATGGLDGQTRGVESVLGISTAATAALDQAGLATLLEPYAPVQVTLETPVLDTDAEGTTQELFPAGEVTLTAADAARLLLARVDGESELARMPRSEAVWSALLAGAAQRSASTTAAATTAVTPAPEPSDLPGFLAAATSGPASLQSLRVQPSFDPTEPNAPELLQADVAYLRLLMATVMPGAVSPSNGNISFRVVNPLGDPEAAYAAVGRLAAVQANVVLVSDSDQPAPELTTVEWHSPAGEAQAGAFSPVLGAGAAVASTERIDGIDATVVLGRDFPAFLAAEAAKVAATSTTSTTTTTVPPPTTTTKATTKTTTKKGKG